MGIYTKSGDEKIYTFSSKPRIPGDGVPDVLVKFQIVSRTQPCSSHHYFKLNSHTKLSKVRRHINPLFKNFFNNGFIFLSKTKEILRSAEASLTVFDILPKLPAAGVATPFLFPDVQYKEISHDVDGERHLVVCACVVFVYEASKVSHWDVDRLRDDLSASTIEGFSFIPTDIMSWRQNMVECRASTLHQQAAVGAKEDVKTSLQQLPLDFRMNSLKDQRGANPLHYAAENGHLEVCEILITGIGRDLVNQRDMNLRTPLHCALYRKNVSTITYLLQLSSNITSEDIHGNSCLELLEKQKEDHLKLILTELQFECIEPILQYSLAQLHLKKKHSKLICQITKQLHPVVDDPETWRYLLHYAAEISNKEITENLIKRGCDIRNVDVQGFLPFHRGCMKGNKYIEMFFFKEMTDEEFCLGLLLAVKKKHYSLCQKIRQLKPEVKLDESTMCTIIQILDAELEKVRYFKKPLHSWEEIAKCLLPVVAEDKDLLSIFVFDCAFHGSVDILSLLESLGASFSEHDHMGRTPLHEACQRNHVQIIDILLQSGANPNATDWRGSTSLHYACAKGNVKVVCRLLKEDSVSADIRDNSGRTPLLIAAYHNRQDTICTLLKGHVNRIDIHATDVLGHSILHYAVHLNAKCLDLLFEQLQKAETRTVQYTNTPKDWSDEIVRDCWYKKLWATDFSSNKDWKLLKEQSKSMTSRDKWHELMRQKQIAPFGNKRERTPWARPDISSKKPTVLKKAVYQCTRCKRYISTHMITFQYIPGHMCPKNCAGSNDDRTRKRYEMQPFKFHRNDFSDGCSPLIQALKMNQQPLVKKLDRLDPELKRLKDGQNRSPLWFAVDTGDKSVVKTAYELSSRNLETGLVYHVIVQMQHDSKTKRAKRKQILDFLLSVGGSADETIGIGECVLDMHGGILKDFLAVEFCAFIGDNDLFELLVDKSTKFNENYCLGIALIKGNLGIIDALVKRRMKLGKPMLSRHEIGPILDLGCNSKFLSLKMMHCLLKICPDAVYNTFNDKDNVRLVGCSIEWGIESTGTTLGSLFSRACTVHGRKHKSEIGKVAKFLINHKINLDSFGDRNDKDGECHISCEAYYSAVKCELYDIAALILENTGHEIWKCVVSEQKCHYFQIQRKSEEDTNEQIINQETQEETLKNHLRMGCQRHVPEIFLKNLLISGKEYLPKMSKKTNAEEKYEHDIFVGSSEEYENLTTEDEDSDDEEKYIEHSSEDENTVKTRNESKNLQSNKETKKDDTENNTSIEKTDKKHISHETRKKGKTIPENSYNRSEASIVKEFSFLLSAIDDHEVDISRLLKIIPELFNCTTLFKYKRFQQMGISSTENAILYRLANLQFSESLSLLAGQRRTLLHFICYTDNIQLVKALLKAVFPIDVNAKEINRRNRSYCTERSVVDAAATAGSYNAYKVLIENGATVTGNTFVACCRRNIIPDSLKNFLITLRGNGFDDDGSRLKILKDICSRKESFELKEKHMMDALYGVTECGFWQILLFLVENFTKETFEVLKKKKYIGNKLFQKIPDNLLQIMIEACIVNRSLVNHVVFAQMLLGTSKKTNDKMLMTMMNKLGDSYTKREWKYILCRYDDNGFSTVHNVVRKGFLEAVIALSKKIGNYSYIYFNIKRKVESPLYYALEYQYWEIAKILLIFNSKPTFTKGIEHLYTKGRFVQSVVEKSKPKSLNASIGACYCYWEYRKPFPHLTNTSHFVASAIAPDIPCFGVRENNIICLKKDDTMYIQNDRLKIKLEDKGKRLEIKQLLALSKMARKHSCSLMHVLCSTGNVKLVKEVQRYQPKEWNIKDENGLYPIVYAVAGGKVDIIDAVNCKLDITNAVEMVWVCLWKMNKLGQNQSNKISVVKRDRFDTAIENLRPLVPKDDEKEEKENVEKERILSLMAAIKNTKYKVCQEGPIIKSSWYTTSRLEDVDSDISEEKIKSLMTKTIRKLDISRLQPDLWIAVLTSKPWVLQTLIDIWIEHHIFLSKITGKFFGMFSLIDMIIICAEPATQKYLDQEEKPYQDILSKLLSKSNIPIHDASILLAAKKNLWDILEEVVRKTVKTFSNVTTVWHKVMFQCIRSPSAMSFLRTFVETIDLYKLDDENKKVFHAYECLASLYKREDVIRYLFKCHIPISGSTRDMEIMKLCKPHFPGDWNILHYALRGGSVQTLDVLLRFLRYDVGFLKVSNLTGLVSMAFSQSNSELQEKLMTFLQKHVNEEVLAINWEEVFLNAIKHGNQTSALQLMDEKRIDLSYCDSEKRNALHYAAILGLPILTNKLINSDTPRSLNTLDQHGQYPIDYAALFGHADLIKDIFSISQVVSTTTDRIFYGCLRGILEMNFKVKKESTSISQNELGNIKVQHPFLLNESYSILEGFIRCSNDRSACFLVEKYPHITKEFESEFRIFHLAVRYKCTNTIEAFIQLWDKKLMNKALVAEVGSLTPLAWAIQGRYIKGIQLLTAIDKEKVSCEWRSTKTGESILHLAVKTADIEIVTTINDWSEQRLKENADNSGMTPSVLVVALGEHHILPYLTSAAIMSQKHNSHNDDNTDFTCIECLLDLCIGWTKMYSTLKARVHASTLGQNARVVPESYFSERGFAPVRRFQFKGIGFLVQKKKYFYGSPQTSDEYFVWHRRKLRLGTKMHNLQSMMEWAKWDESHPFILSMMQTMGYVENNSSVKTFLLALNKRNTETCPEQKMLRSMLYAMPDNKLSINDPQMAYNLYENAASIGLKHIFEQNADHFSWTLQNISTNQVVNSHGFSLPEIAFGFGHCELGLYLESLLIKDGTVDIYNNFRDLNPVLPIPIGWLASKRDSEVLTWDIEKEFDEDNRLKTTELILVSPLSNNVIEKIGKSIDIKSLIPSSCRGKKFQADIQSFKKQQCFSKKSDLWMHCLMGSSLIYGQAFSLLQSRDQKVSSAVSVQIRCLPEGSGEHPKMSIETNGVVTESIGIIKHQMATVFEYDKLPNQRSTDAEYKQSILSEVIPDIESKLLDVFGHTISIKIDWRSIESQRRTSGSINIFNLLRNGNRLAGLEDVVDHCRWFKEELISTFCKETAEYALAPMSTVHEIIVKYVDTLPSADHTPSPKYTPLIPNCIWNFTIDRSTLKYDRTVFPLWSHLYLYNGICVSLFHAAKMIHFKHLPTFWDNVQNSTLEESPYIQLEIDVKSFGAYSISSLHTLISRTIENEMSSIGHMLHTMLRLSLSAKHVVIQNASSSKYTGLSLKDDKITVSIYAHQHKSNEWTVSSENAQSTLLELEDRHLSAGITTTLLEDIRDTIKQTEERVSDQVGLQLKISLDEKRLLSTVYQRYRREMTHPFKLIDASMKTILYWIPWLYDDTVSHLLYSPFSLFCSLACKRTNDMTDNENSNQITHVLCLMKSTYNDRSHFTRVFFKVLKASKVPLYPIMKKSVGKTVDIICQWESQEIQINMASLRKKSCKFFSYANSDYEVLENMAMYNAFKSINCQFLTHDLVVDALENGFPSRFKEKLLPDFNETVSNTRLPNNLLLQHWFIRESSLELHKFQDVHPTFLSVDWRSFCSDKEEMSQSERFLKNAVETIINVFFNLCEKFGFILKKKSICLLQKGQHDAIKTSLSSLKIHLRRLKVDDNTQTENVQRPKSENVELLWMPDKVVIGLTKELDYTSIATYIYSAIIRALEREILTLLCKSVKNNGDGNNEKALKLNDKDQTIDHRKGKMNLELVLQMHYNLIEALTLFQQHSAIQRAFVTNLNDVSYVKSKVTSMNFSNGCLKILISPSDVSKTTLLRGLTSALIEDQETIDTISFQLTGPEIYFSTAAENVIHLTVSDANGNQLSNTSRDLISSKDSYHIHITKPENEAEEEKVKNLLKAESVDLSENLLSLKWNRGDIKYNGVAKIEITRYGRHIDLPNTTVFFGDSTEFSQGISIAKRRRIHMEKKGFFIVLLEHDFDRYICVDNANRPIHSHIPSKKNFKFHKVDIDTDKDIHIRFEVFTRIKKFESDTKSAVDIRKYRKGDNWKGVYKVTCINPRIGTRVRAFCCICGKYLRMITPHRIYEPAQEISIN